LKLAPESVGELAVRLHHHPHQACALVL
jgi:hypothetical protein